MVLTPGGRPPRGEARSADVFAFVEGATITCQGGTVDFRLTDQSGAVVRDSRQERIDRRNHFAQAAAAYIGDPVANSILRSYSAAVNDAGNELIRLYEVRDALATHFGGEVATRASLSISSSSWSTPGRLADREPLTQGRHRGQHLGALRDATPEELETARSIARAMIDKYLAHLEKANPT